MSTPRNTKKMAAGPASLVFPECPACARGLAPPILVCRTGHSVCGACAARLRPPLCPVCQEPVTQMRNRSLEEFINKAKVPCPNRSAGCPLSPEHASINEHKKECYYRTVECPLAAGLGRCSWSGVYTQIREHVKEQHPSKFTDGLEGDIEMEDLTLHKCDLRVHVAVYQKNIFIITFKVDAIQRLVYFAIQLMGPKKFANKFNYEIHVSSQREKHKKVIFMELCSSDVVKLEDIFRQCNCAVLPLNLMQILSTDNKVSFRFVITNTKNKWQSSEGEVNPHSLPQRQWSRSRSGPFAGSHWPAPGRSNDMAS